MRINHIFRILLSAILLCSMGSALANDEYIASKIPDELKKNAYAVVRVNSSEFIQINENNGKSKDRIVTTILDKKGESFSNFYINCDKFIELDNFQGTIYDASGKAVKKIKKGDLTQSSIDFGSFATDNYVLFYECKYPTYPYTVEYTYQVKFKNGIIAYPSFSPYPGFNISVEKADYKIEVPDNVKVRTKSIGGFDIKEEKSQGKHIYVVEAQSLTAIPNEPNSPASFNILPRVYIAPTDFCYDSACGNMTNWKNYGLWVNGLLTGRDELPMDVVAKIQELTKNAKTDRDKAEILYDFLQKNSRYVSIQLGIGGFQPIAATSVYKNRFGDCKGLTNLMKAMLKVVGIESNYCEISMRKHDVLLNDFANVFQTNHAILVVPLKSDTVWLECTSQTLPFGFVHSGIAGNDALIVSDEGGKICRLPTYTENENLTSSNITFNLTESGDATGNLAVTEHLFKYDIAIDYLRERDREKVVRYINSCVDLPKMELGEYTITEDRSSQPSVLFNAKFNAPSIANKTGTRLFIPICPLQKGSFNRFSAAERTHDIDIKYGYTDRDSIVFNLPEGFTIESLPKDVIEESKYGTIKSHAELKGNLIIHCQTIVIHKGLFPKEEYNDIKDFYRKINNALKRKIVVKKE